LGEERIEIHGGKVLEGEVSLSGAKNAALPMIVVACIGHEPTVLENVPTQLNDIRVQIELLQRMGAAIEVKGSTVRCSRGDLDSGKAPADLVGRVRSSLLLLGLYAGLKKEVFLPHPGGDKIGDRKHDLHLMGLQRLGAHVEELSDGIYVKSTGLVGSEIDFYLPSTTGTENIMIAGTFAQGSTILRNANTRPEVVQLGDLLVAMGARIKIHSRVIEMEGVDSLQGGARVRVLSGWDEAVTYIAAASLTRGEIVVNDFDLDHVREETRYLRDAGVELFEWRGNVYVSGKQTQRPFDLFTAPYPGVNSDMQPIFAALALTIPGTSTITDLRFTDRFQYVEELRRFGGDIQSFGNTAIVRGGHPLKGVQVRAPDIRGGMACVLAGLVAEGQTTITNVYQIERGYENFVDKLSALGAIIRKVTND